MSKTPKSDHKSNFDVIMPVNKHALIRYHALDKCFSNFARRYYIEDLIEACNEALYNFTGDERYGDPLSPGISRRQVFVDIAFMESPEGWSFSYPHPRTL